MPSLVVLTIVAAIACAALVPLVRRLATHVGAIDVPGGRRAHSRPIPRLGGLAIFTAFLLTLGLAWLADESLQRAADVNPRGVVAFACGALLVFGLGVVDDLWTVRPALKLAVQLLAASIVVVWGDCRILGVSMPGGGPLETGVLSIPLTLLWIVLVTNAVNLLDGLDGLAAGVVAIALIAVVAITRNEHASVAAIALIVIGVCAGFLVYNSHPATIFMGDSGSLFLGFSLAVLSTYASAKSAAGAVTLPLIIVALPVSDTLWAIVRRYVKGLVPISFRAHVAALSRVFVPDRKHIHHRLIDAGLSQRQAVYVLYGIQAVICAAAIYIAAHLVSAPVGPPAARAPAVLQ